MRRSVHHEGPNCIQPSVFLLWIDIQLIDRHFCPMILESPLSTHRNPTKRYPLLPRAADRSVLCNPSLNNILPTISSSHSEFPSAFITVPSPKKLSSHDPNSSSADSGVHLCCSSPTEKASPNDSHETATRRMCTASTRSQQSSFVWQHMLFNVEQSLASFFYLIYFVLRYAWHRIKRATRELVDDVELLLEDTTVLVMIVDVFSRGRVIRTRRAPFISEGNFINVFDFTCLQLT